MSVKDKFLSKSKFYFIYLILFVFTNNANATSYGCNLGNEIYPNATGGVNSNGYPTYYNSNPIPIRWWDEDPKCGIRDNKIRMRSNSEDKCQVIGNNWGVVYKFNHADNSCKVTPVPIDDYIFPIMICLGVLAVYHISRKNILLS